MDPYQPPPSSSLFQLNLDATNGYTLRSAAAWSKVLAVVGFIMGALFLVLAFKIQQAGQSGSLDRYLGRGISDAELQTALIFYMIFLVVIGLIFFISGIFAINFANKISRALKNNDQDSLRSGFAALRNYYAFKAILKIICALLLLIGVISILSNPDSTISIE